MEVISDEFLGLKRKAIQGRRGLGSTSSSYSKSYKKPRGSVKSVNPLYGRQYRNAKNPYDLTEYKFLDMSFGPTAIVSTTDCSGAEVDPATGCTGALSVPAQGDTAITRDGFRYVMQSIHISGLISCAGQAAQTAYDSPPFVFIALVHDKQTNITQLNSEDVFINPLASVTTCTSGMRNMTFTTRFKVLKTWQYQFPQFQAANDAATTFAQSPQLMPFVIYKDLKNIPVRCTAAGTAANVNTVIDNSLHLIALTDAVGGVPLLAYNARLRFVG